MNLDRYPLSRRRVVRGLLGTALSGLAPTLMFPEKARADSIPPTVAIIIDDMGNSEALGNQLLDIDYPMTFSFLPFRPFARQLAARAHALGHEVTLHMPMASVHDLKLGAAGLEPGMDQLTVATLVRRSLQDIPYVQGVNNHMGSLLTQERQPMDWVMREVSRYPLYFVDSLTIASSVAADVASEHRIPNMTRDVFLDDIKTPAGVDAQFKRLIRLAKERGSAVAIGHPHPVTVEYLTHHMRDLDREGIAVATVSSLWQMRNNVESMFADEQKETVIQSQASWKDVSHELRSMRRSVG